MAKPIAHLPFPIQLSATFGGATQVLATSTVELPITVTESSPGHVQLVMDPEELRAAIRRALNALDIETTKEA
ncbi:hypothetical protein [Brachybacterium phenoliresistens]|uniref:hypothetical protein n=1 Tax=Brachybacterium phenoliresistens TaxID=396014 RepID=UPI0031CDE34C